MPSSPSPKPLRHPLEGLLGYHLRRASAYMQADLTARIADLGLTIAEMSTLLVIAANPGVTQSEIGRLIAIKRANMTPLTAGLVAGGLVQSRSVDGRSSGLTLTHKGEASVATIHLRVQENEQLLFSDIPGEDRENLVGLVRLIWADSDRATKIT